MKNKDINMKNLKVSIIKMTYLMYISEFESLYFYFKIEIYGNTKYTILISI